MSSGSNLRRNFNDVSVAYRYVPGLNTWDQGFWLLKNVIRWRFSLQRQAINDVSLEVSPGEVLCVIGKKGSGKTSLLRAITDSWIPGFWKRKPDVMIDSKVALNGAKPEALFHKRFDGSDDLLAEIKRIKALVSDSEVPNPPFIVIDEPTRNLDHQSIKEVSRLIQKIKDAGVGVVIATHDIPFGLQASDKLLHLESGQAVCKLDVNELEVDGTEEAGVDALSTKQVAVTWPGVDHPDTQRYLELALNQQGRFGRSNNKTAQSFAPGVDRKVFRNLPTISDDAPRVQETSHLSVVFNQDENSKGDKKSALQDVNAHVRKGEILALIGPSGCGKSTYLQAINRMLPSIADVMGDVIVGGKNIQDIEVEELRRSCGSVAQKAQCFPHMSIMKEVTYPAVLHGLVQTKEERRELAESLLKKVGLWDEVKDVYLDKKRSGTSLSGGQQQRLCIARALAADPKFLLMDEPCSHLDPISTAKVEELIKDLNENHGVTVIIVTHEMSQAARLAHRTAVFWEGNIIEQGLTKDVLLNPQDPRTKSFVCKPGTFNLGTGAQLGLQAA